MILRWFQAVVALSIAMTIAVMVWGNFYIDLARSHGHFIIRAPDEMRKLQFAEEGGFDLGGVESVSETSTSGRFLLYINAISRGEPNSQYSHFAEALKFGIIENRSLADAILFVGHRSPQAVESIAEARYLADTFDTNILKEIINMVPVEKFKVECNSTVETVLTTPRHKTHYPTSYGKSEELYSSMFGIKLPSFETLPTTNDQLRERLEAASTMKCVGVWVLNENYGFVPETVNNKVDSHIVLSRDIRNTARDIENAVFHGLPYLAVNYQTEEQERYVSKCGADYQQTSSECNSLREWSAQVARSIGDFMKINSLSNMYVAAPLTGSNIVNQLQSAGVPNVISAENITTDVYPPISFLKNDNYFWSLLEQGICIDAEIYIGNYNKTWTRVVNRGRFGKEAKSFSLDFFRPQH